jgi:AraC-like DNA-binding protein
MKYQEIIPNKHLQPYVQYFWVLENLDNNFSIHNFKIIPDGVPALIFQDTPGKFIDQYNQEAPRLYIYGQFTKYTNQRVEGSFRVIGAYLKPAALKTLFNIDASELSNKNIPLEDLLADSILEQLVNAVTLEDKITIISDFLLLRVQEVKHNNQKAIYASSLLAYDKSLKEVRLELNTSERTLERLMKEHVGISPKSFSRIMRFQSSLNLYRNNAFDNLTDLTYQSDYFDQSHLIREFKEFTGVSPKSFLLQTEEQLINYLKIKE